MSQTTDILDWLNAGKPITALEALQIFGCFRLAARIADIRAKGIEVTTDTVKTHTGKSIAQYSLGGNNA
jgi:hypothetical protein|tara:strand:+ start:268 stop:474 length:207 start_codon:yes stop_codon:yes gene_type:complete